MLDSVRQRANMVATQLRTNDVTDARLIKAMLAVPREDFVPETLVPLAYMEGVIPLGNGRVLLDPRSFAKLAQLAAIKPEDRLLDVGCATGYSTAVLAQLAKHAIGLEQDKDLAAAAVKNLKGISNAEVASSRMSDGLPAKRPFDVIFLNGAVEKTPEALIAQLAIGGRMVCVVRQGEAGQARLYMKQEDDAISERSTFDAHLPVLPGFEKSRSFAF
jgi:protein-L-isoaspartate(D-aspartate) O-methyltransferase